MSGFYRCRVPTTFGSKSVIPDVAFEFFREKFKLDRICINDWSIEFIGPKAGHLDLFWNPGTSDPSLRPGYHLVKVGSEAGEVAPSMGGKGIWTGIRHGFALVRTMADVLNDQSIATETVYRDFYPRLDNAEFNHYGGRGTCYEEQAPFDQYWHGSFGHEGSGVTWPKRIKFGGFDLKKQAAFESELVEYCEAADPNWDSRNLTDRTRTAILIVASVAVDWPVVQGLSLTVVKRKPRFAGRSDLPKWRAQHEILSLGRKFKKQQTIVAEDNQAGGRGRAGTGIRKLLAKAGDIASDALLKAITKEVKKRSKVAGAAAGFAVKLAKAALRKKAATAERQRKRGLKPTVRSMKVDTKEEVQARYEKEVKAAAKGVEVSQVKQDKELERILRREKAAIKRQNRKILEQRRRWLKHQNKIEREKRKFAKQVARLVKEADKKALRKFSFRQKRPCLPTQQRRPRRKRKRLTSRGRASRRPATKRKK